MTRFRTFSASTGLAALLAAGIIVLGSANLAWAKGGSGSGGGNNYHSSQSRSSGPSSRLLGITKITIHPIIYRGGNGKSKHASKDHKHHKGDDYDKTPKPTTGDSGKPDPSKPPIVSKPPVTPPPIVEVRDHRHPPGELPTGGPVIVRDHRGEGAPPAAAPVVHDHRGEGGTTVTQTSHPKGGHDGILDGVKDLGHALGDVGRAAGNAVEGAGKAAGNAVEDAGKAVIHHLPSIPMATAGRPRTSATQSE